MCGRQRNLRPRARDHDQDRAELDAEAAGRGDLGDPGPDGGHDLVAVRPQADDNAHGRHEQNACGNGFAVMGYRRNGIPTE